MSIHERNPARVHTILETLLAKNPKPMPLDEIMGNLVGKLLIDYVELREILDELMDENLLLWKSTDYQLTHDGIELCRKLGIPPFPAVA